ncbi:DNA polymerase III subunit gamma/tau [Candidatus Dependentiae bacterium]|nr:MAG: DNA polymerase III subunit gamma/tau [Candidatus Dependentiae bacterium]
MSILNLTRKFRILSFEEIVGQQLVIRMLKNSLYTDRLFPVYLFFGQHGCGKTSIARVFGMAVNCKSLSLFRKTPKKQIIPCLHCDSCLAMQKNSHPDFIEIDAASYTGVDNIRAIIESASYLPVIGSKKIYLIDEAHMLSKASFNALLKILEEPPANALFMLATTDVEKIIDTVRSRCFQLFLRPIASQDIQNRLTIIAQAEQIQYDTEALWVIAEQGNGSVRDALNLIERVRSAYPKISLDAVYQVLGKINDLLMKELFIALYQKNKNAIVKLLSSEAFAHTTPTVLWRQVFQFLRAAWYAKQGVEIDKGIEAAIISELANICSTEFLGYVTALLYKNEIQLLKTNTPRFFIEHLFIAIVTRTEALAYENDHTNIQKKKTDPVLSSAVDTTEKIICVPNTISTSSIADHAKRFLVEVQQAVTPMIYSLLNQAHFVVKQEVVLIILPQSLRMLEDVLKESESTWIDIFKKVFGSKIHYAYQFTKDTTCIDEKKPTIHKNMETTTIDSLENKTISLNTTNTRLYNEQIQTKNKTDFTDASKWPQVNLILKYFPGTTTFIE